MTKSKIIFAGVIVVAGVITSRQIQRGIQAKLRENDALLWQQDKLLAQLAAENQRLSNLVAQPKTNRAGADDRTAELMKLRSEADALREQTNQLAKELAERRSVAAQTFALEDFNLLEHNRGIGMSSAGVPRTTGKLNDARAITAALRKYADEHQGQFPLNVDQGAPYLPKPLEADSPRSANAPLSGTNEFEIVYQGSLNDLTNIPLRRVALIRERQPWLTPDGKWARTYGYADGAAEMVESDDDFQSWDSFFIIPAPSTGQ